MRHLKPLTIVTLGPLLLGVAIAAGAAVFDASYRNARAAAVCIIAGVVFGLLLFVPIAAPEVFRPRFVRRHLEHFDRWSALVGALGLGHLLGLRLGEYGFIVAMLALGLCACSRIYLAGVPERRSA
jgi:hypothetical protein